METQYITIPEAAKRLGIDRSALLRWVQKGKVKAIKPGHDWLINIDDLDSIPQRSKAGRPPKKENPDI